MKLRLDLEGHGLSPAQFPKIMRSKDQNRGSTIPKKKENETIQSKKGDLSDSDEIKIPDYFDGKPKDEMSQHGFDIKSNLNEQNKSEQM
jgi:hypothetical protein